MAWKNLQQTTLVDAMLIEHEALKELDDVHELIGWSKNKTLLSVLHSSLRGEKAWPPLMMFKALVIAL
jgi:transposase, IS5 family